MNSRSPERQILSAQLLISIALTLSASLAAGGFYKLSNQQETAVKPIPSSVSILFSKWKATYGVHYQTPSENSYRLQIFNRNFIALDSIRRVSPEARFGPTFFSDKPEEELKIYKGEKEDFQDRENYSNVVEELKKYQNGGLTQGILENLEIDHRNLTSGVKDQGACGSCWAFSATTAMESVFGGKVVISPQHFFDCDKNATCINGGDAVITVSNVLREHGYKLESDAPYLGRKATCNSANSRKVNFSSLNFRDALNIQNIVNYQTNGGPEPVNTNPMAIRVREELLRKMGPLTVSIYLDNDLYFFQGGLYYNQKSCSTFNSNHSVTLIGMDKDSWVIQNSFSARWGDKGYIRIKKVQENYLVNKHICICGGLHCSHGRLNLNIK